MSIFAFLDPEFLFILAATFWPLFALIYLLGAISGWLIKWRW